MFSGEERETKKQSRGWDAGLFIDARKKFIDILNVTDKDLHFQGKLLIYGS